MKPFKIVVIDYGLGNLYSVRRALEVCGAENVCVSGLAEDIVNADKVILPGVGAFGDGIRGLEDRSLIQPLIAHATNGKPLLGICLGMQMLASTSDEFGLHRGLGLISGKVRKIDRVNTAGTSRKTPFIGWASLNHSNNGLSWDNTILSSVDEGESVYLVHSYHFEPTDPKDILATYSYEGDSITAAVHRNNITGLQFHPEKSSQVGLRILSRFVMARDIKNN